jgi:hypothetical protein
MRFVKLIELREVINSICDNYVFDDIDHKRFNKILQQQIDSVNSSSKVAIDHLISEFGDYRKDQP